MTKNERIILKQAIEKSLSALYEEISQLEDILKPIAPDCSLGRLTRQEMIQEQQVSEHAKHEADIRINKLLYAMQKIDTPEYGICKECEEDIAIERLMILPESLYCVSCMSQLP